MACNCINSTQFRKALLDAIKYEQTTGKKAAVFKLPNSDNVSFTEWDRVGYIDGICCYYDTNQVEYKAATRLSKKSIKKVITEDVVSEL